MNLSLTLLRIDMTFSTSIGTINQGIFNLTDQGAFNSVVPLQLDSVMVSSGDSRYTFVNKTNFKRGGLSSGVIQIVYVQLNQSYPFMSVFPIGNESSVYDPSSVLMSTQFTTFGHQSSLFVEYLLTTGNSQGTFYANLYGLYNIFPTNPPLATIQTGMSVVAPEIISQGIARFYSPVVPFNGNIPVAVCGFQDTSGPSTGVGAPSDYLLLMEFSSGADPSQTVSVTTSSTTPVTAFTVNTNDNPPQGCFVYANVVYFDSVNLDGSAQTFMVSIPNYGSGAVPTLGAVQEVSGTPTVQVTPSGNDALIEVVGVNGKTFQCVFNYTVFVGGF